MNLFNIQSIMPEIVMAVLALIVLLLELFVQRKEFLGLFSIISIAIVAYFIPQSLDKDFLGMFLADKYSIFFKFLFFTNFILTVLLSIKYIEIEKVNLGEFYALAMFATLGMMIMASAVDLIVLYLGLELMALSTYVLAGFMRHDLRSNEASLKYFFLGAFSSAILLYGITIVYGITGTTDITVIEATLSDKELAASLLLAIILLITAFGFKIALVPFHMWVPDVYEGAPTSITAFMSFGSKAAGFAAMGRVFIGGFESYSADWSGILVVLSILSMAVGNILAIQQQNIKRMLAYSSIAHAGYAVIGIIAGGNEGLSSMMNYMLIYGFMNMGAFGVIIMLRSEGCRGDSLNDYKGFARGHPLAAALMLVFMFSLIGIPPTAGFIGKFYLFKAAINADLTWLAVVAGIFSVISAYFYLRVVMYMYMHEPEAESVILSLSPALGLALLLTTIMVIFIGIYPSPFLYFAYLPEGLY